MYTDTKEGFLNTREAADFMRVTQKTIREWMETGRIRKFRMPNGAVRIAKADLLNLVYQEPVGAGK